jgi:predicted DNA-binding transcriptional regulator YafY
MEYSDAKGQKTIRIVSPIRYLPNGRLLALCLSRCAPRQFYLNRCQNVQLKPAHEFVMPVPMDTHC